MTLDQLIFNYDLAKTNAARSCSVEDREIYFDLVEYYARRIRNVQGDTIPHWSGIPCDQFQEGGPE